MLAAAAVLAVPALLGLDAGLGALTLKAQRPSFHYLNSGGTGPTYVVFDGFIGHPEKRFAEVMEAFGDHPVLFVNPAGDRFDLEFEARMTVAELQNRRIREVILVGGSLGAKKAYRTAQLLPESIKLDGLKLIDPLYDGSGVKNPLATIIKWTAWHPGPMQNWLLSRGHFVGRATTDMWPWNGRVPTNDHQAYGFYDVRVSRVADEARESKRGPVPGKLPQRNPAHVTIIHCRPENDEVLEGQWQKWRDRLRRQGHMVELVEVGGNTHHMGIDTEPGVWLPYLKYGLALAS